MSNNISKKTFFKKVISALKKRKYGTKADITAYANGLYDAAYQCDMKHADDMIEHEELLTRIYLGTKKGES